MKVFWIVLFVCPLMAQVDIGGISTSGPPDPHASTAPPPAAAPYLASPPVVTSPKSDGRKFYRWSLAAVAAGNAADAFSSWHQPEANPLLASPGSDFDARSVALKSALLGTSFLIEHWAIHRNPGLYRAFAWLNLTIAGMLGGVVAHNTTLH